MALTGMDIASYQAALDVRNVGGDFVIVKATEGVSYVNPYCDRHYQQAKAAGKLRGVYHFARNRSNSAAAEAKHFVNSIKGYIRDAVLVLDWEDGSGVSDVAWAKAWLDTVTQMTGVRPLIYMSASPASQYAWESVSRDYGLWVAGYPTSAARGLEAPSCPYRPGRGWNLVMWQYTSSGRIPGYGGNLDLNVFYGDRTAWLKYAGATTTASAAPAKPAPAAPAPAKTATDGQLMLAVDGVPGGRTYARFNQVMGTGVAGSPSAALWAQFQRFLNGAVSGKDIRNLTGATSLATDGIAGPRTWKVFQYWVGNVRPRFIGVDKLTGANWNSVVDGVAGPNTWRAVQHCLNSSYAGSGKLLTK